MGENFIALHYEFEFFQCDALMNTEKIRKNSPL